jgi:hypothetical protein
VNFGRDVLPILSDKCFRCHGPDARSRKAGLRLDTKEGALRAEEPVIASGKSAESELYIRVSSNDPDEVMPPPRSGRTLTPRQIETLRRWIDQGARWGRHWAFEPPRRPEPPPARDRSWPRNPIDQFVLSRLDAEGLKPSPEAERTTLIRRLSFDLTGLPPTLAEVDDFVTDPSADAYEKVVDRLLGSPRFGERMASRWLDAARYADTNGYQSDGERFMWRWRDWVIDAYNRNLPFDQFTVEQLAGDLLLNPSLDQLIATGFNRNHRGNAEGGIIPEEYAVEYVVDRVETSATVWLGLTIGCARCHDHKFDPFSQKEFYQLFAIFNNVPERGKAIKYGNSPPLIDAPTADQQEKLRGLDTRLASAERHIQELEPELASAQARWEKTVSPAHAIHWAPSDGLVAHFPLDGSPEGGSAAGEPVFVPGRLGQAVALDGRRFLNVGNVAKFGFYDRFSCGAWVKLDEGGGGVVLSRMVDQPKGEGFALAIEGGKVQVNLVKRWLDDAIRVETARRLEPGRWHHILFAYDGSRVAEGVKVYIDGDAARVVVLLDDLNQSFQTSEPFRIGGGGGNEGRFRGLIDDLRVYEAVLTADDVALLATIDPIESIVAIPPEQRTDRQLRKLRAYFLTVDAPEPIKAALRELSELRGERVRLVDSIPSTMIMREMDRPRETHLLIRGAYDKPGETVAPGVPSCLPPLPEGERPNRLGFARWLVDPTNPLTARVTVNRHWQMLFGTGLVKTAEDFGAQGEPPSHPELLDWLATEFVRNGWDTKALLRTIVLSATYRQSSKVTSELLRLDPENRLLARGPRFRLPAEMIRDQALAASGLLVERLGGPSVRPYQPSGLWKELTGSEDYRPDSGPNLYRRSLYTFWKRTVAPPSMTTFDSAGRETCTVREVRTNTPLQALNLMNDVTFVEAARVLAERVLTGCEPSDEARIERAFRLVTSRPPSPTEQTVLLEGLRAHRARYAQDRALAQTLIRIGTTPPSDVLDPGELATFTAIGNLLLNLDETITKE